MLSMFQNILQYRKEISIGLLIFLLCLVGFRYRTRQYQLVPYPQENFDEVAYMWLGKSLLSSGVPMSWSGLHIYQDGATEELASNSAQRMAVDGFSITYKNQKPRLATVPTFFSTESRKFGEWIYNTVSFSTTIFR